MRSSLSDATARASLGDAPYGETAPSMTGAKGEKPVTRSEAEIRDRAWSERDAVIFINGKIMAVP